ncbi:hypothetical protein DL766_005527 [Monosporascus sp. MC13-8B]|uniref:Uncharacterized protein n=1 Tax=Monosporascus cannonballus TaxID=155416 RepID=A0ABY0H2B6_9PEZI|nr:hypothetical protein DL763_009201 [Monosporascus cannonballus]RYO83021.1 hypothetical protein DL762_006356 [Monosporascus cannonballus]RYP29082.1 hypothetical protein DL766_005527 [Monosporascus sp. MC13-8B]
MSSNSSARAAPPAATTAAAATTTETTNTAPQQPNNNPQPQPRAQPQAAPAAGAAAGAAPHRHHPHQRPPSPPPPVSPITPPLKPTLGEREWERGRPKQLTHHTQTPQTAENAAAPPPEPLDFDTNPDVLALRSAIAVLQNQRRRAAADMVALDRAKSAALADPAAFLRDLAGGRVGVGGDSLFGPGAAAGRGDSESESDSDSEGGGADADADVDVEMGDTAGPQAKAEAGAEAPSARRREPRVKKQSNPEPEGGERRPPPPPWSALPGKQNVVRCPPINWAQYAVVGESLDRLHSEQQRRPAQGAPAVVGPDGRFEFVAEGAGAGAHVDEPYLGVAAPYSPLRDRIDRKPSPKGSSSSSSTRR